MKDKIKEDDDEEKAIQVSVKFFELNFCSMINLFFDLASTGHFRIVPEMVQIGANFTKKARNDWNDPRWPFGGQNGLNENTK